MTGIGVFLILLAVLIIFGRHRESRLTAFYMSRPTVYRAWVNRYGKPRAPEIKAFLRCFGDAFFVSPRILHKLGPDDQALDYYKRDYKPGEPDFLETVRFARELRERFGYDVTEEDGGLAMGQLFERVTGAKSSPITTSHGTAEVAARRG